MKLQNNILLCAIFILLCVSCKSIFKPKNLKYCYTENGDNGISDILKIDGYYIGNYSSSRENPSMNFTNTKTVVLFKNGICAIAEYVDLVVDSTYMDELLEKYPSDKSQPFRWGVYKIAGDTIKLQYMYEMYAWDYFMWDEDYLILSDNSLRYIPNKNGTNLPPEYDLQFNYYPKDIEHLCTLKKYKWFKCK